MAMQYMIDGKVYTMTPEQEASVMADRAEQQRLRKEMATKAADRKVAARDVNLALRSKLGISLKRLKAALQADD